MHRYNGFLLFFFFKIVYTLCHRYVSVDTNTRVKCRRQRTINETNKCTRPRYVFLPAGIDTLRYYLLPCQVHWYTFYTFVLSSRANCTFVSANYRRVHTVPIAAQATAKTAGSADRQRLVSESRSRLKLLLFYVFRARLRYLQYRLWAATERFCQSA